MRLSNKFFHSLISLGFLLPTLASASQEAHHAGGIPRALFWTALNFGLLAAFLFWKTRQPLASYLKERQEKLAQAIRAAEAALAQASKAEQEAKSLLAGAQAEAQQILSNAQTAAERERQRILETARTEAGSIVTDAKQLAQREEWSLKNQVANELIDQVVENIAGRMQTEGKNKQDAAIEEFLRQLDREKPEKSAVPSRATA